MDEISLADFVSQSLISIARGVSLANEEFSRTLPGARANPEGVSTDTNGTIYISEGRCERAELIEFDVAVRATQAEANKSGIGVTVAVFGGGMVGDTKATRQHDSRLKFSIPLMLPQHHLK